MVLSFSILILFQFPSNGKAYPKVDGNRLSIRTAGQVSIPFKRESVSKAMLDHHTEYLEELCFNSLQTGKRIQRTTAVLIVLTAAMSFNSLQTGKRIQSGRRPREDRRSDLTCFNSLQTGKRIQRVRPVFEFFTFPLVSIPFKRESVSKADKQETLLRANRVTADKFQFPSNGKAYPKLTNITTKVFLNQFQFPSNGKAYPKIQCQRRVRPPMGIGFNSLQTGKRIQRKRRLYGKSI